jgi:uncharacterized YccA/Bax inhibitor family protein
MRTANPALNPKVFAQAGRAVDEAGAMTVSGTINKTGILLILAIIPAFWVYNRFSGLPLQQMGAVMPWMFGGLIAGFILAMITIFAKRFVAVTAPLYAVAEGIFLGAISLVVGTQVTAATEGRVSGGAIVFQAIGLTFGTLFVLLGLYRARIIKVTEKFRLGVFAATGGIALFYVASMVLGMFGVGVPLIHSTGFWGIAFSLFVVGVAALNLVLDFDFIERGSAQGAPKLMEWYGAFGLMVTLVWLYLEILRLLSKLNRR